jgi:hypothetical protein
MSKWLVPWGVEVKVMRRSCWGGNVDVLEQENGRRHADEACQPGRLAGMMTQPYVITCSGCPKDSQAGDKFLPPLANVGEVG